MGVPMDDRALACPLLSLDEVRQRLAALVAELNRLERDRTVFARAFHTYVAQTVHAALLEDEARLRTLPTLDLTVEDSTEIILSPTVFDPLPWTAAGSAPRLEILDL
jgi:hypothetical protein